jgi:hypothetical protein
MEKLTSSAGLKAAILLLEAEHRQKGSALKEQFENINPLNLINGALSGGETPGTLEKLIVSGAGLALGYLSRKIFVGSSGNMLRILIGKALQFGAASLVANSPQAIKYVGQLLYKFYSSNKKKKKQGAK